jgi:hypothetical protein
VLVGIVSHLRRTLRAEVTAASRTPLSQPWNRNIRVGVFPEREEILIGRLGGVAVTG